MLSQLKKRINKTLKCFGVKKYNANHVNYSTDSEDREDEQRD